MDSYKTLDSDELKNSTIPEFETVLASSSETQDSNVDEAHYNIEIPKALCKSDDIKDVQNKTTDEHLNNTKSDISEKDRNENFDPKTESVISKTEIKSTNLNSSSEIAHEDSITEKDYVVVKKSSEAHISDADINSSPIISNSTNEIHSIESE
ncbi:hypothetical protein AYI70_g12445, partial [Smittium culicis]